MFLARRKIDLNRYLKPALTNIYGIGRTRFRLIQQKLGFRQNIKFNEMKRAKRRMITRSVDKYTTTNQLKRVENAILRPHFLNGSYKGIRMRQGMPANGQRTHSNASMSRTKNKLLTKLL